MQSKESDRSRGIKRFAISFLLLCYALNTGIRLYFGIATLHTTIVLYALLLLLCLAIIAVTERLVKHKLTNVKLITVSILLSLFAGEVVLKYVLKKNLTYSEKLGGGYYSTYSYINTNDGIMDYLLWRKGFWYLHGKPGTKHISSIEGHKFSNSFNSQGLRDAEWTPPLNDTTHVIMGIGDSFTEGVGTAQDSTWLKFLEIKLNTHGGKRVKTINAGASGSDVFFEYVLLRKLLKTYHPNTVILAINSSDIDDVVIRGGNERFLPGGRLQFRQPPKWEKIYAASYIFRAAIHGTQNLDWMLLPQSERPGRTSVAIDAIESCIMQFSELAKAEGFKLMVVFHPREAEIKSGIFAYDTLATSLQADSTLTVVNLKDGFMKSGTITPANSSAYYWPVDLHHNAKGYKAFADVLAQQIQEKSTRW